jgi:hypothetical protein
MSGVASRVPDVTLRGNETPTEQTEAPPGSLLMDCQGIMREFGFKRATADKVMRWCPVKVVLDRRVFVYRADAFEVLRSREIREAA